MLIERRPLRFLLVAAAILGAVIAVQTVETRASSQTPAKERCKRYERHALTENSRAVVVWIREADEPELPPTLSICRRRDGRIASLDAPIDFTSAFPPPTISLVGTKVAYAFQIGPSNAPQNPGELDEYITIIAVYDIENRRQRLIYRVGPARLMKIGSLVLSKRGSLAWIACPEPDRGPDQARLGPTCDGPGARDYVYVLPRGESRPRRVGAGRRIDPNSLKRMGDAITWREGRGWKRASFR